MKRSQLRARYWRIVFFFGRVTAHFIFWEIFLPRIGLGRLGARNRSERLRRLQPPRPTRGAKISQKMKPAVTPPKKKTMRQYLARSCDCFMSPP